MQLTEEQMKQIASHLEQKEKVALEMFRGRAGESFELLPELIRETIEDAFLIGYDYGGIEYYNDLRKMQKNDPVQFYAWIKEGIDYAHE